MAKRKQKFVQQNDGVESNGWHWGPQQSRLLGSIEGVSDEALHAVFLDNVIRKHEETVKEFEALLDLPMDRVDSDLRLKAHRAVNEEWNIPKDVDFDDLFLEVGNGSKS